MTQKQTGRILLVSAAVAAISSLGFISGCTIEARPARVVYVQQPAPQPGPPPQQEVVVTDQAPPPDQDVIVGVNPYPDGVWINGYWGWGGGRWVWRGGYWDHGHGRVWVRDGWERGPRGYVHVRGHFR
jgi:hypothetical protein